LIIHVNSCLFYWWMKEWSCLNAVQYGSVQREVLAKEKNCILMYVCGKQREG
jgi:hypothetical protein